MQICYIDTHSHLYEPEFDNDRAEAMQRASDAGVERLLLPAIDRESYERMFDMCREYPERCFPMMGLHPTSVNDNPAWREDLHLVEEYLENPFPSPKPPPPQPVVEGNLIPRGSFESGTDPFWCYDPSNFEPDEVLCEPSLTRADEGHTGSHSMRFAGRKKPDGKSSSGRPGIWEFLRRTPQALQSWKPW